mmetsp:Transcript_49199/g.157572  ORF Transcript_49199/g.157572 Transcript_49199/m.157572 type:complete len:253 (-) Transcript_49199:429-1187(-)
MSAHQAHQYHTVDYWEGRYVASLKEGCQEEERGPVFDWLTTPEKFGHQYFDGIPREARIVDLGCGNSTLCEELARMGFVDITGVDFSPACVDAMGARARDHALCITYLVADCTRLADCTRGIPGLEAGSAGVVVDKGCIDALMNGYDQAEWWHERKGSYEGCEHGDGADSLQRGKDYLAEVVRLVDKRKGRVLLVTLASPSRRQPFLEDALPPGWLVGVREDEDGNYIFDCRGPEWPREVVAHEEGGGELCL